MNIFTIQYFAFLYLAAITSTSFAFWVMIAFSFIFLVLYVYFKYMDIHHDSWQHWLETADFSNGKSVDYMSKYFRGK